MSTELRPTPALSSWRALRAALGTYLRARSARYGLYILVLAFAVLQDSRPSARMGDLLFFVAAALLAAHLRRELELASELRLPGAALAHRKIAGLLLIVGFALIPAIIVTLSAGPSALVTAGILWAMAGFVFWTSLYFEALGLMVAFLAFHWWSWLSLDSPWHALLTLGLGALLNIAIVQGHGPQDRLRPGAGMEDDWLDRMRAKAGDETGSLAPSAPPTGSSLPARARLWAAGNGSGWLARLTPLLIIVVLSAVAALYVESLDRTGLTHGRGLLLIPLFAPVAACAVTWHARRRTLAHESLRPTTRGRWLAELCTALAFELFSFWLFATGAIALARWLELPGFGWSPATLVAFSVGTLLAQPLLLTLLVASFTLPTRFGPAVLWPLVVVIPVFLHYWLRGGVEYVARLAPWQEATLAPVALVVTALVGGLAFLRWRTFEPGRLVSAESEP